MGEIRISIPSENVGFPYQYEYYPPERVVVQALNFPVHPIICPLSLDTNIPTEAIEINILSG